MLLMPCTLLPSDLWVETIHEETVIGGMWTPVQERAINGGF